MPSEAGKMFSVRLMPWHKHATVPEPYPQSFAEARGLAGLDWDPVELPAIGQMQADEEIRQEFTRIMQVGAARGVAGLDELMMQAYRQSVRKDADYRRIARSDTLATLSYQRDSYHVIPNSAFGEIIDSVIRSDEQVKLETGGCLAGGRKVWMLARLDEPILVPGDSSLIFPFLAVTSRHDGEASCAARLTTVRVLCANSFSRAEAEGRQTGAVYSFSHRGDWRKRTGEARDALRFARAEAAELGNAMTALARLPVTGRQARMWLERFIPSPPGGSDRMRANTEQARNAVLDVLHGETVEGAGIGGTAYALVQAAGEYLDYWKRAKSWESRLNRTMLSQSKFKVRAVRLAREAATA